MEFTFSFYVFVSLLCASLRVTSAPVASGARAAPLARGARTAARVEATLEAASSHLDISDVSSLSPPPPQPEAIIVVIGKWGQDTPPDVGSRSRSRSRISGTRLDVFRHDVIRDGNETTSYEFILTSDGAATPDRGAAAKTGQTREVRPASGHCGLKRLYFETKFDH
jgi:hypothetical protein